MVTISYKTFRDSHGTRLRLKKTRHTRSLWTRYRYSNERAVKWHQNKHTIQTIMAPERKMFYVPYGI